VFQATIDRRKGRIVVCENKHIYGGDFLLTFAPVMGMNTALTLLALAQFWDTDPLQGNVPNAYPRARKEDEFETIMEGVTLTVEELKELGVESQSKVVLSLEQSLYGLKQAGSLWDELLDKKLKEAGYERCATDMCVYVKIIVGTYVDDFLVVSTKPDLAAQFFEDLKELEVKNLGVVATFLGMRVARTCDGDLELDQTKVIEERLTKDSLQDASLQEAKAVHVPIGAGYASDLADKPMLLTKNGQDGLPSVRDFQSLAGSIVARQVHLPRHRVRGAQTQPADPRANGRYCGTCKARRPCV
ncbi:TPA: hypothetical protein N0F65_008272, partial [Lagenidium giganteum]